MPPSDRPCTTTLCYCRLDYDILPSLRRRVTWDHLDPLLSMPAVQDALHEYWTDFYSIRYDQNNSHILCPPEDELWSLVELCVRNPRMTYTHRHPDKSTWTGSGHMTRWIVKFLVQWRRYLERTFGFEGSLTMATYSMGFAIGIDIVKLYCKVQATRVARELEAADVAVIVIDEPSGEYM